MNAYLRGIAGATAVAAGCIGGVSPASAQSNDQELRQKLDQLQQQIDQIKAQLKAAPPAPPPAEPAPPTMVKVPLPESHEFLERKPVDGVTFFTRGGELSIYGNFDISLDTSTKGIGGMTAANPPTSPVGNTGWMPDISTNLSYVGVRGFQSLGSFPAHFVYQLETQIDVSAASGTAATNSNTSAVVKGGLTSRNSFIGLASPQWGAFKVGKTDAPYKVSTSSLNPFSGMWGDYSVIMGNTGGDNRVEFGTRLDHSIWYESPGLSGFNFAALISPGQNRADDNSNLASGESDCAGGNVPGSGGLPVACNDGSYGNAYSVAGSYRKGPIYVAAAYELHKQVNRTSDLATYDPRDVGDESAYKFAGQYQFSTGTTVSAIYEKFKRNLPADLEAQNERSRSGYWFAVVQQIGASDSLNLGWAHANATPGDPGQHNTPGGANPDNAANMYTLAWKHQVDKQFGFYADYAVTANHSAAHYDLGAGGRAVTTDCHDASNPDTTGFDPNGNAPHCWAGGRLQGVSVGMKYQF
jgi:predicted porin/outer membrane murein-binding lipoprotein Lpp